MDNCCSVRGVWEGLILGFPSPLPFPSVGDVAQLGERMNGIHEVRGSIPLVSTNKIDRKGIRSGCLF